MSVALHSGQGLPPIQYLHQADPAEYRPEVWLLHDARIDKRVNNRLKNSDSAFGGLYKRVWNKSNIKRETLLSEEPLCQAQCFYDSKS